MKHVFITSKNKCLLCFFAFYSLFLKDQTVIGSRNAITRNGTRTTGLKSIILKFPCERKIKVFILLQGVRKIKKVSNIPLDKISEFVSLRKLFFMLILATLLIH